MLQMQSLVVYSQKGISNTMKKPFYFSVPDEYSSMIRDLVYGRLNKDFLGSSVQNQEDAVSVLCEIVCNSMEQSYKIGYTLGKEDGKNGIN